MRIKKLKLIVVLAVSILFINSSFADKIGEDTRIIHLSTKGCNGSQCKGLIEEAKNEKIILVMAGLESGWNKETGVFGIEGRHNYFLVEILSFYYTFVGNHFLADLKVDESFKRDLKEFKEVFSMLSLPAADKLMSTHEFFKNFIIVYDQEYRIPTEFPEVEKIYQKFNELNSLESIPSAYKQEIEKLIKDNSFEKPFFLNIDDDLSHWVNFVKYAISLIEEKAFLENEEIVLEAINKLNALIIRTEEVWELSKIKNIEFSEIKDILFKFAVSIHSIIFEFRSQSLLKNIISFFEEKKTQGKPFYAVVDDNLILFVEAALKEKGYEVKIVDIPEQNFKDIGVRSSDKLEL